jgi:hypothetical protein
VISTWLVVFAKSPNYTITQNATRTCSGRLGEIWEICSPSVLPLPAEI